MIWGPVSLQFNLVFCFALISFYFLRQHSFRHLMWALVFSGAATFTQGSGLITFAIGFVWLIGQKRFIEYGAWGIVTLVISGVYFFNYSTPGTESKIFSGLQEPGRMGVYFASFLGSALSFKNQIAAFILGLVVIAGFFYLTRRKYYELNGPIYCLLVFLLFSALAASMSRSGFGIDQALSYRYKTQSVLGIVALLIAFIELHSSKLETQLLPAVGLTLLSIIFFGFAYGDGTQKLFRQKEIHIENMNSWFAENSGLVIIQARRGNALMDSAIRKGYFRNIWLSAKTRWLNRSRHSKSVSRLSVN